jgi:hypothetical protein
MPDAKALLAVVRDQRRAGGDRGDVFLPGRPPGMLTVAAIVTSLFSAVTVALAAMPSQGEPLSRTRMTGLGLAVLSVALVAAGGSGPALAGAQPRPAVGAAGVMQARRLTRTGRSAQSFARRAQTLRGTMRVIRAISRHASGEQLSAPFLVSRLRPVADPGLAGLLEHTSLT